MDDMDRLIETVTRELAGSIGRDPGDREGRGGRHGTAGFRSGRLTAAEVAGTIDHTLLRPEASQVDVERLCREAAEFRFATVCVNPTWVALCSDRLAGGISRVCTVVGFPLGASVTSVKVYEASRAVADGAAEIDMVVDIGALKSGQWRRAHDDVAAVVEASRAGRAICKVIIEAALLTSREKVAACVLAQMAGADFVKTSTGFGPGGATGADVALMRRVVGPATGVKAAGGIRDYRAFCAMVDAGANRIGTSAGVAIVREALAAPDGAT